MNQDKINTDLKKYLGTEPSGKRTALKTQYLERIPVGSELEQALCHLGYLEEYTRRLNLVECKKGSQPIPQPSTLRNTDLFVCVEICAESIRENPFLQKNATFWRCWILFQELLERVKSKNGSENYFEMVYFLLYLAALIFKRHIMDGEIEKKPLIFSLQGYTTLAAGFPRPLFESVRSTSEQLENLTDNLRSLVST